jgi:hypothetical protein
MTGKSAGVASEGRAGVADEGRAGVAGMGWSGLARMLDAVLFGQTWYELVRVYPGIAGWNTWCRG